ncbi:hypothetical protein HIM_05512 [Hirsutella minnesotensis 3608]|uniref:DNA polymerase alpha subunit B n=1 Tax=Hirsutella minnesotensis 3608 TaxID=1043627 RepID=A0A0F7ZK72_9HYPO|nr:hypothetical protein HIM_05512 [Hirsutella minnesotensis 3608]
MADAAELKARFSPAKELEADVLAELQSMLRLHGLSAEDLYFKWESYCIRMDVDAQEPSLEGVRSLKRSLQDALEKSNREQAAQQGARLARAPGSGSAAKRKMDARSGVMSSPSGSLRDQLQSLSSAGATSFNDRANPGEVLEVLNDHLRAAAPPAAPFAEPRIRLTAASDQKKMGYKPLAMKLSEASEILDDRIDEFAALVQQHHGLDDTAFGSAASQGTSQIVAVGRIASDAAEGRLNTASLVLETSRRTGMGFRVPLRMNAVSGWAVFPGQVVALRGSNAQGTEFVVSEILDTPLLPNAASSAAVLEANIERLRGGPDVMDSDADPAPLNMLFAAGPYTADDNLDFGPLHALCSQAADTHADALVLAGPFIDVDHPLIAAGDFDLPEDANYDPDTSTMTTVFKYLFAPALNRLSASNPHLVIILVPSVRDILDKHVSWPQDSIPRKELGVPKAVRIVSNPMTLSMNEMVLGVSSQDILYELRSEELAKGAAPGDLMGRLCRYLVEQRHYFPLFPPTDRAKLPKTGTAEGVATGAVLDLSYLKLGEMVNVRPDVMLVPSALPPFVKVVESVLAINPGYLSKRKGAGTYARMTLYPPKTEGEAPDAMVSHRIFDRARVEIVRI